MKIFSFTYLFLICMFGLSRLCAQPVPEKYEPTAVQVAPVKARGFFAGEVRLLEGPFKVSQDAEARNLLSLDPDRLLAPFVIASGAIPKQPMYLGWETKVLPGVALSFYLSGISRMLASTGDSSYERRLNYVLDELYHCQKRTNGYLLGTLGGKNIFTRVENEGFFNGFGNWGRGEATPYYSLEKLMSGLRDTYRITHHPKALYINRQIGNWLVNHMSHISDRTLQRLMQIEYGGMNWVLADLYADTNDKRFLELSRRWHDSIVTVPMTQERDLLPGQHANMQFPKISGLAARYPYSGDPGDLTGARFFWNMVVNHRTYATGGNSESEYFHHKDSLSGKLTPFTEENCNEYNMLRLTQLLFNIEPDVKYADYMERTLYNHILSAQNTENGELCYFLPLMPGAKREYQPLDFFSCCTASGLDSYTRHAEYIYSHTPSSLYVNLFIASELDYKEKGLVLRQETRFPDNNSSVLKFICADSLRLDLAIRNPYWAKGVSIRINGRNEKIPASADGYFHIDRNWKNGDLVELNLPMHLREEAMPDNPDMIALFYGPVLLAADLNATQGDELVKQSLAPGLVPGKLGLDKWLKPVADTPLHFMTTVLKPEQVSVVPLYQKKQGEYAVYWNKLTEKEWKQRLKDRELKKQQQARLEVLTIDRVKTVDPESETSHGFFGNTETGAGNEGILGDQSWRRSVTASMGYEMKVDPLVPNYLYIKCIGRAGYESWNCSITIDGKVIKTIKLKRLEPFTVNLWDDIYAIPPELTRGKNNVKVAFEPVVEYMMQMPRLIEMRTLNKQAI